MSYLETINQLVISIILKRKGSNLIIDNEVKFKIALGIDLYKYYAKE